MVKGSLFVTTQKKNNKQKKKTEDFDKALIWVAAVDRDSVLPYNYNSIVNADLQFIPLTISNYKDRTA